MSRSYASVRGRNGVTYEVNGNAVAAMSRIYRRAWPAWIKRAAPRKEGAPCATS